jgi:hypothetical protein
MEIHAWFNPYRAISDTNRHIADNHVSKRNPEWLLKFGQISILDPGRTEVRNYVTRVIMDVVRRYDIDGVHFDDYFYPYGGIRSEDFSTFTHPNYNRGFSDIHAWRRDNVDLLVKMVYDSIQAVKPRVKFGISPFGIWKNSSSDPEGSNTSRLQSYYAIYADSRKWIRERWVDYLAPQVYWSFGFSPARYEVLVPWWNTAYANERHLYVGQAVYRVVDLNWPVQEIINQVNFNRGHLSVKGSIHFSAKYFRDNNKQLRDSLLQTVYSTRALVPTMDWQGRDVLPPNRPDSVRVTKLSSTFFFTWSEPAPAADGDKPIHYLVYRSTSFPVNIDDMRNLVYAGTTRFFADNYPLTGTYAYTITALDRNHNESLRSSTVIVDAHRNVIVGVVWDVVPELFVLRQNFPNPFNASTVIQFSIPFETRATLRVFDLLGREVAVLVDGVVRQGEHQVEFDARDLASGMYIYRLAAGGQVLVKRMQVLK